MEWSGWLGLGFGLGFAAGAYVFSRGVRNRTHAAIRGIIWGSPKEPPARKKNGAKKVKPRRRKCVVCPESSPEDEMVQGTLGKQTIWFHPKCQDKLTEAKSKFDYGGD